MKKIIWSLIILLVVAALAGSTYYFFLAQNTDIANAPEALRQLFPGGGSQRLDGETPFGDSELTVPEGDIASVPDLRQLHKEPVIGARFVETDDGLTVRFVERATGHIYEADTLSNQVSRLSNTTIPGVQNVLWVSDETLVMQYLRDNGESVETVFGTIGGGSLDTTFLPHTITFLTSDDDGSLFYLEREPVGTHGVVRDSRGVVERVFSSPLSEWLPQWAGGATVALTTKPSSGVLGNLFFLNTNSGSLTHVLRDHPGLVALTSSNTEYIFFSTSQSGLSSFFYETDTGAVGSTNITTLPDKCAWGQSGTLYCAVPTLRPAGALPDMWYQGAVSFNDTLWRGGPGDSFEEILVAGRLPEEGVDVAELAVSSSETHLLFRNKRDGGLWLYAVPPISSFGPREF